MFGALVLAGAAGCNKEPDLATVHRAKGSEHLNRKEWGKAIEEYELSLKADPKQEKVWEKKAFAHMQAGELSDAAESLLKTMEFKTEPAAKTEVYRNIAGIYMQRGGLDQAEEYYLKVLESEPKDEVTLGWLAEVYSQRGGARSMAAPVVAEHLDKALTYYDQVLALNPNSANTYLNKRIVMAKYMEHERVQKEAAELEAKENAKKDKAKAAEAKARAEQHSARMAEFQTQFEELTRKFSEAQKASKQQ